MGSEKSLDEPRTPAGDSPLPTTEAPPPSSGPQIPNGGLEAWTQVAGSFFLFFNGWGIVASFGVFQTYYELELLSDKTPSEISWIGSIQSFLLLTVGFLTGPLYDWGYFRALIITGCFLEVFGMMMLSLCEKYWEAVLAQAIVVGLGCGCIFIPSVAILPSYFSTKRGLANGVAASGTGLGGVIYPIIFRQLQPSIGFGWTTRVIAFVMLATSMIPLAVMKMRAKPSATRKMFQASAWKEPPYVLWTVGVFFGLMSLYAPLVYVESYAIQKNIMSTGDAFYLLPILNTGSIFGRILPSLFVDKIGALNVYIPCCLLAAILSFAWVAIKDTAGLVVFSVLYGFISGLYVTLPAFTAMSLSPDLRVVGVRMGMAFAIGAVGFLIGTPIAGAIVKHGWVGLQVYTGATLTLATIIMVAARVSKVGYHFTAKA